MSKEKQPINNVQWIHRSELKANHYNPNKVAPPELKLLKISISEDGWTQPIVVNPDYTIVDGFHRWTVSGDPQISAMTDGYVPCVVLDIPDDQKMMSTIRHNRARGTHGVLAMAEIVQDLVNKGCNQKEIMQRLGMDDEEVSRLLSRMGMHEKVAEVSPEFKQAWKPDVK